MSVYSEKEFKRREKMPLLLYLEQKKAKSTWIHDLVVKLVVFRATGPEFSIGPALSNSFLLFSGVSW